MPALTSDFAMFDYGPDLTTAREIQGPCLLGIFLNILLYGVVLVQAQIYYTRYPKDPLWLKIYVGLLISADTLNTAFNIAWIYITLINNFGAFLHNAYHLSSLERGSQATSKLLRELIGNRQKTGFKRTDNALRGIIRSTVSNGLLTASFTIGHMVSWLSTPSGIHYIFNYGAVKLYTNSIISSLNSRDELAARMSAELSEAIVDVGATDVLRFASTSEITPEHPHVTAMAKTQ
ncbi:uncharacterized protein PHACADRAFT_214192 [Phanerochaete carnosa HHB-10118-sp]|uniref:DUF6534 domain-containing protein n=1 Tax=Phanerochaete carnosa (strain HHB-10118-sp) TaxID=650164 RepID=K5VER6_PHACS|nr:uncharacterized protein PHACADRAFT_214192 [Phanerochaete carnosa HHB-10118-sp]EKM49663.1 hypothetical protein PHACADRAFT_214192 [Phanerochaete carnosa HHB-10118-sp]